MTTGGAPMQRQELMRLLMSDLEPLIAAHPFPELSGTRIFLTGATGFIGYWLLLAIHSLNLRGAEIRVLALSRDPQRFLARRPECGAMTWLEWVQGDVRSYPQPSGAFDSFIHAAADTSPEAAADPLGLFDSIVSGTRHVLEHARSVHTRRILLLSSGAIYGEQPETMERLRETAAIACNPLHADNAYGEAKRAMEMLATCYAHSHAIEPVIARCFAFIGYGLPPHLAIGQFIRDALSAPQITVKGNGRPVRSYLYAADLAIWLLAALSRGNAGCAYNVGSPQSLTLGQTAATVQHVLAPDQALVIMGGGASARQRYVPDTELIEQTLGIKVWTDLPDAIAKTARCVPWADAAT